MFSIENSVISNRKKLKGAIEKKFLNDIVRRIYIEKLDAKSKSRNVTLRESERNPV